MRQQRAHWPALVAADFFTTEVWTAHGLVTFWQATLLSEHDTITEVFAAAPERQAVHAISRRDFAQNWTRRLG